MRRRFVCGLILFVMAGFRGSAGPLPPEGFLQDVPIHGPRFGGFSALHLSADGLNFLTVSDHGAFVTGSFERDASGKITAIHANAFTPLLARTGQPLSRGQTDSEGLAVTPDGQIYISFEGPARVLHYQTLGGRAEALPTTPAFARMDVNRALEALALGPDGTLYTIPEIPTAAGQAFPVYRLYHRHWDQPFTLPARGPFMVSDATFGPDGRLYILEREFLGLGGFATRLRRFDLTAAGLVAEQTLFQTEPGTFDNLEGLSVWRDATGLRATMISDDNFTAFLRSQIVEFRLPD
jgi:hypothetical protein